jgi:RNA polymerase sigma-70 factor, ECF subfamily
MRARAGRALPVGPGPRGGGGVAGPMGVRPWPESRQGRGAVNWSPGPVVSRVVLAVQMIPTEPREGVDEERLIADVLAGNADAFEYFVRQYQRKVFRIAMRLLRDSGEADCVSQETFIKAFRALGRFEGRCSFEMWLTRIAVNTCHDRLKRRRWVTYFHQAPRVSGEDEQANFENSAVSSDPSPEGLVLAGEIRRRLSEAIERLSPRQKTIFVMKHYEELSIPEIAELTGLDQGTVKSHLFRAAHKIRERLKDFRGQTTP